MCQVNVTEFRKNLNHFINVSATEEVHLTRNGEVVAILSNPDAKYFNNLISLCGCLQEGDTGESCDQMIGE